MDYFVGGVAALISGDVTPNRPRPAKTALTPIKHKQSPNITPKSAMIEDRCVLLSPSVQKKKALVKKSPKRIFQNPDMNVTDDGQVLLSPKGEKAKKHLKNHLDGEEHEPITKNYVKINKDTSKKKNDKEKINKQEKTPKKNKKSKLEEGKNIATVLDNLSSTESPLKMDADEQNDTPMDDKSESLDQHTAKSSSNNIIVKKKNKKNKKKTSKLQHKTAKNSVFNQLTNIVEEQEKRETNTDSEAEEETIPEISTKNKKKKGKKNIVNPNAVTNKDSDSEHESDDESLESEDEKNNKEVLEAKEEGESTDEEDNNAEEKEIKKVEKSESETDIEKEIDRTLFVGNVLFNDKIKKQIKKIFSKHGEIDSMRIRSIPVKDPTMTPKLAVIKRELHPERSTVNVYVKFKDAASVESALSENNTVLNGTHLRVSRCDASNLENDPKCAVFVGNLPFAIEDEALWKTFESCGEIKSVRIIRDRKTSCGKGFGYVNFASKDSVELALAMSEEDLTIKNRIVNVKRISQLMPKHKVQQKASGGKNKGNNANQNFRSRSQGGNRFPNRNQNGKQDGNRFQNRNQDGNGFQNRNQGGNRFQNRNQGGNDFQNRNQGGNSFRNRNHGGNSFQNRNQGGNNFQNRNQGGNDFQNRNHGGNSFQNRNQGGNSFQNRNQGGNGFQNRNQGGNDFHNRNQGGNKRSFPSRQFGSGDQDQSNERRPFGQWNEGSGNQGHMEQPEDGASRRIANKRKSQESSSEAPATKRPKVDQPRKEKKPKKEFIGVTAEKKKKKKQDKGQKKKKALSEILTKS